MASKIRAAHILLMYQGSMHSTANRSKQEAEAQILELKAKLDGGADFADLARAHSDCPSGEDGGNLGSFGKGTMVGEFEHAAFALEPGQCSGVVETAFGYHLILRLDDQTEVKSRLEEMIRASHVLLMYKGSMRSTADRSKQEAETLIQDLKAKLDGGADFAELARAHSDCPSGEDGGDLGRFGKGMMVGEFEQAAFALKPGQYSGVVETPFGYHLILRTE